MNFKRNLNKNDYCNNLNFISEYSKYSEVVINETVNIESYVTSNRDTKLHHLKHSHKISSLNTGNDYLVSNTNYTRDIKIYTTQNIGLRRKLHKLKEIVKKYKLANEGLSSKIDYAFFHWLKEKNIIEHRKSVLRKIIIRNLENQTNNSLIMCLRKWKLVTNYHQMNTSAKKIQIFVKNKFNKKKKKIISKSQITTESNINLGVLKNYKKKILTYSLSKIKQEVFRRKLIKFIIFLKIKMFNGISLSFLHLLKSYKYKLKILHFYARVIQSKYRQMKSKNKMITLINIRHYLKLLINKRLDRSKKNTFNNFLKWKENVNSLLIMSNYRIIQNFILRKVHLIKTQRKMKVNNLFYNLFTDFHYFKIIKPSITDLNSFIILYKGSNFIRRHCYNNFYSKFLKHLKFKKLNIFLSLFSNFIDKINRFIFNKIKQTSDFNLKSRAKQLIYNKYLLFKNRKNKKINLIILSKQMKSLINRNNIYLKYCLRKWLNITSLKLINDSGNLINLYLRKKLKLLKCDKYWKKLLLKNKIKSVKNTTALVKLSYVERQLSRLVNYNLETYAFEKLKHQADHTKKLFLLNKIITCSNKSNNKKLLDNKYSKWKTSSRFLNEREYHVNNLLKVFKNYIYRIFNKKLLISLLRIHSFKFLLAKYFLKNSFKKIQKKAMNNKAVYDFSQILIKMQNQIECKSIFKIKSHIYKIYVYKQLRNVELLFIRKMFEINGKQFFDSIKNRVIKLSEYKYSSHSSSSFKCKSICKYYTSSTREHLPNTRLPSQTLIQNQSSKMHSLIWIVKIITQILLQNQKYIFLTLTNIYRGDKLKKISFNIKKKIFPDFLSKLKKISNHRKQVHSNRIHFRMIFNEYTVLKLKQDFGIISKITRLMYLIKLVEMHKKISQNRFKSVILKKWRFNKISKKLSLKKMTKLYTTFQTTFLNAANEMNDLDYSQIYEMLP